MSEKGNGGPSVAFILAVNVILVSCFAAVFGLYGSNYRVELRAQNLADIKNLNRSASNVCSTFFKNQEKRLDDSVKYITLSDYSLEDALDYLCSSNSDNSTVYEIVGADGKGYASVRGADGYVPVDYTNADYRSLAAVFASPAAGGLACTREFTDSVSARKSFALYASIPLTGQSASTLMLVARSDDFQDLLELDGGYEGMASVLVNRSGDYVFGSAEFKSANLFNYFYVFNGLTLDERNALETGFSGGAGSDYYYTDSRGRACVFVSSPVPQTEWYCVSAVPISSFRSTDTGMRFAVIVAALLLALMGFNIFWLNLSNRRLRASVRREKEASSAKTDFLSRMSHDIRTPLNVIIGSALLARREQNPPATQEHLANIDRSGKFLLSLVNDILDLNKVETGKMELHPSPYSFADLRANITAIIGPLCAEKGIEFRMTCSAPETDAYLLDPTRTDQIFFNILSNSVKFTPPGGHVSLSCGVLKGENGPDTLSLIASDDGRGMSADFQEHMFEAFTQESGETAGMQGTGLGLAIVRNLVDLMGGTVSVESAPGKGTVFRILLPAVRTSPQAESKSGPSAPGENLTGRRILLFEDNDINAEIALQLLRTGGLLADRAENGKAGLERFAAAPEGWYDAILMDLRMPVMDGLTATRALRALPRGDAKTTPIIAMTANAYDLDVKNCLDAGMNSHLAKPIDPDEMFRTLSREIAAASAGNAGPR